MKATTKLTLIGIVGMSHAFDLVSLVSQHSVAINSGDLRLPLPAPAEQT
jgi:hypothetical protein